MGGRFVCCLSEDAPSPSPSIEPVQTAAPPYEVPQRHSGADSIPVNSLLSPAQTCGFSNVTHSRVVGGVPAQIGIHIENFKLKFQEKFKF